MHTEKQNIFDEYAKSKGFNDWSDLFSTYDLFIAYDLGVMDRKTLYYHIFAACDLVQKEQQKRIADSVSKSKFQKGHYVDISSILSENNLIK